MAENSERERPFTNRDLAHLNRDFERRARARISEIKEIAGRTYEFRPQTQCRVCMEEESRVLVNKLLSHALSLNEIVQCCEAINARRGKKQRITRDSVWYHSKHHFNLQEPAKAVIRRILEERAEEQEKDWVAGVGGIVTAYGYLEVLQQKAFETLMREDTVVPVDLGLQATLKLHDMTKQEAGEAQVAEMMQQMGRIIKAVRENCSPEQQDRIRLALAGEEPEEALEVDYEDVGDEDDEEFVADPDFSGEE